MDWMLAKLEDKVLSNICCCLGTSEEDCQKLVDDNFVILAEEGVLQ